MLGASSRRLWGGGRREETQHSSDQESEKQRHQQQKQQTRQRDEQALQGHNLPATSTGMAKTRKMVSMVGRVKICSVVADPLRSRWLRSQSLIPSREERQRRSRGERGSVPSRARAAHRALFALVCSGGLAGRRAVRGIAAGGMLRGRFALPHLPRLHSCETRAGRALVSDLNTATQEISHAPRMHPPPQNGQGFTGSTHPVCARGPQGGWVVDAGRVWFGWGCGCMDHMPPCPAI